MNRNKFLRFLLFGLILVILIELGIIFIGNSSSIQISSSPTISPAQTPNLNNPTSNLQTPTSNQTEWKPSIINHTISNQFGKIYIALGRLKKIENQKQLLVALVEREMVFTITQETEFLTIIHALNSLPQQIIEKEPFELDINQVYLFEWKEDNIEESKFIPVWRIARLKNDF